MHNASAPFFNIIIPYGTLICSHTVFTHSARGSEIGKSYPRRKQKELYMTTEAYKRNEPYIFISYAHRDSSIVLPIIRSLSAAGFQVWYDEGIEAGTEWPEYVAEKLYQSSVVIAFISSSALESQNCRREINFAISKRKEMLTVYIEDIKLSLGMEMQLGTTQAIFYTRMPYEIFLQNLEAADILKPCRANSPLDSAHTAYAPKPKPTPSPLTDFKIENGALTEYVGSSESVVIPDCITSIGKNAFFCSPCKSVTLSESVRSIDSSAFFGSSCRSITIPNGLVSIADRAFCDCRSLTEITLPDSLREMGEMVFNGCDSLTSITIPDGVKDIGDKAFCGCRSLKSITIPYGVTSIGTFAFSDCTALEAVKLPDSVMFVSSGAFKGCSALTDITISRRMTSIGKSVLEGCAGLTSIKVPDGVTSIGECAFMDCAALKTVDLPDTLTDIGPQAFASSKALDFITIPNGVISIGAQAFDDCQKLSYVSIPRSVERIGKWAFIDCPALSIFCEAAFEPDDWDPEWNPDNRQVGWSWRPFSI